MDVYISTNGLKVLNALTKLRSPGLEGFLLGHRRGPRHFVENVLPSMRGFFPSLEAFGDIDACLGGSIVGFFSYGPSRARLKKLLAPFACGKVVLDASSGLRGRAGMKAFLIDYDKAFVLRPIPCILEGRKT